MNSKMAKLSVISTIVAMLALVAVALAYAHTNRTYQLTKDGESVEDDDHYKECQELMEEHYENCEELMEEWMHTDETYDEHHEMMHEETEQSMINRHDCH